MKKTRAEILIELRHRLGANENTEHLLDWIFDVWETRDFLLRLLGREYTNTIIEATESSFTDILPDERVLCELPLEEVNSFALN
jgi:hypothetical protein